MSIFQFFNDWVGGPSGFEYVILAFACAAGLIIFDNILRFTLNIISSLFKKKGSGH